MPFKKQLIHCDLRLFPHQESEVDYEISMGDLHGNALLLLNFLIRYGVIKINQRDYEIFVQIYCLPSEKLTKEHINCFNRIIDSSSVNLLKKIRFLGDMFADRGSNDYFTLKILAHLHKHHLDYEIILSNHDVEFLLFFELYGFDKPYKEITISSVVTESLQMLIKIVRNGWVNKEWLQLAITKAILPKLKALSYTYEKVNEEDLLIIYSHAPIDLHVISKIANELNVPFDDSHALSIKNSIISINQQLQLKYTDGNLAKLFSGLFNPRVNVSGMAARGLERLIWNRTYEDLKRECRHKDLMIYYVHGHDSSGLSQDNVFVLDGLLGKSLGNMQGIMNILLSRGEEKKRCNFSHLS
ncbi:hypothetical protein Lgra_3136 [Legionella gratiana]|uniref:Dot/Icm secretion system substrate n=1 Tax=Legionella gratiana TaxID=45066 RepID=A0A378JE59_9GAMM|nr:Dot/Icm T4SS effector Wip [Legionella gratiana]KTD06359.1 hypothetical protein Lgra_3136 [Legionella gratiana]STX45177.1 Dot/Icm secretion system substrate [Legionella gratiana]